MSRPALAAALLALAAGSPAAALEPRFDHRDLQGPFVEAIFARDTVAKTGGGSASSWRSAARVAWGLDVSGEGDELVLGLAVSLRSHDDPERERVLLAGDLRYRAYFGTEEAKTFLEAGLWVPIRSRLAAGPLVGLGFAWDFSRTAGVYAGVSFATAFGDARIASGAASGGAQLRF